MKKHSFLPLYITNFFGVVNDNFLKTLACFVVTGWMQDNPKIKSVFIGITAGALVLPYIFFSPLADRLTVVFEKKKILRLAKWAELPIMAIAIFGLVLHSPSLVVLSVLLMGLQSSLYSPSKYALVRDVGGAERISTGMGGMEGITFFAVLIGTIAASFAADFFGIKANSICLLGFAFAGLICSYFIRADEQKNRAIHAVNPIRYMKRAYRMVKKYDGLSAVVNTLAVFWLAAAMLQMGMLVYGQQVLHLDSTHTGILLSGAAIGIVAGQVIAGFIDKHYFLLASVLISGFFVGVGLLFLFFTSLSPIAFGVVISILAFVLGVFKLPFDTEILKIVQGTKLNTALAYLNQVSFIFMLCASGIYAAVSWLFGPRAFLLVLGIFFLFCPVLFLFSYRKALCCVGRWVFARRYKIEVRGLDLLPRDKAILVLPNHPALVDPMLVTAQLWRIPLRPLVDELFFNSGVIARKVLHTLGAVKVPDLRRNRSETAVKAARGLTRVVVDALSRGENVMFYPSGHIQTEGREEIGTRQLAYNVCREMPSNVEVVCVRTVGLWGSIWSRKGRCKSPEFGATLFKSIFLWFAVLFTFRKRKVIMTFEVMTNRLKEWSANENRLRFNKKLENWYNEKA